MQPSDLQKVCQWAKSNHSPSEVYNAACRMLDDDAARDEVERLRAELAEEKADNKSLRDRLYYANADATRAEAERDALKAAIEQVETDAIEQQHQTGTTTDRWKLGVYAQASRTRRILRAALEAPEKGAEGHGGRRTPQTQGASEGGEANGAQEGSRG